MADPAAAGRRGAVPGRGHRLAAHRALPQRDHEGRARRPAADGAARTHGHDGPRAAPEEPRPARRAGGDRAGDGIASRASSTAAPRPSSSPSRPRGRRSSLAKLAAIALVLAACTALAVGVAWVYTAILFEPLPVGGWVAMAVAVVARAASRGRRSRSWRRRRPAPRRPRPDSGSWPCIGLSLLAVIPAVDRLLPTGLTVPSILLASGATAAVEGRRAGDRGAGDARPRRGLRRGRRGRVPATRAVRR